MKKITLLFFLLSALLAIAQPTTDAPTPTQDQADVISVFSDAYTNVATNYDPNWGQSGHTLVNPSFDPTGGGTNFVLAYPNFNYQGTELTTQNAAAMEFLHIDLWTSADPGATDIQVSPINNGTGTGETLVSITYTSGTWISVDIPKSSFTGMTWDSVFQMKFAANGPGSTVPVDIYLDNVYFWKAPQDPNDDATLSDLQVDGATISGFGPGTFDYTYEVQIGTTTVPQITLATPTEEGLGATASITQAPAIPGDATVLVTSANTNFTETYTVSFTATLPDDAPNPTTPDGEVLSMYGDTGGFTNIWIPDYSFGSFVEKTDLDSSTGVDEAIKMDLSIAGYGEGTNSPVDISAYNYVHFDYFAPNNPPGANGHEVKFILIGQGEGEKDYILKTDMTGDGTLVFDSWQSVNVPLSHFEALGLTKPNYLQFKLGSTSDLNTTIVYFDNIYFSVNPGTLGADEFAVSKFNAYPNPSNNVWNIEGTQTIESVLVYDVLGKQVMSVKPNSTNVELNAASLTNGIYFAKVSTALGTKSIKLIKE